MSENVRTVRKYFKLTEKCRAKLAILGYAREKFGISMRFFEITPTMVQNENTFYFRILEFLILIRSHLVKLL